MRNTDRGTKLKKGDVKRFDSMYSKNKVKDITLQLLEIKFSSW